VLEAEVTIESHLQGATLETIADDVREGLSRPLKALPPKYFYDARGSELFDRITEQPEYYPTRCERAILNRRAAEVVALTGARELLEVGSGSASKTRALLYAMAAMGSLDRYVPFDCDPSVVERCAGELTELYPGLSVHGVVGDFERHLDRVPDGEKRVVAFLGGTIGNLYPDERARFLEELAAVAGEGGWLLLGTDLVKDVTVLEAAYDDAAGVTAEFNLNVLRVLNRELGADFDVTEFEHVARFDPDESWIEMSLRSRSDQVVSIPGAGIEVELEAGERIRTEISTKFKLDALNSELAAAGLATEAFWTDPLGRFGVTLAARQ
jgi:L-histidine Nalpha-methyltransferase